MSIVVNSKCRKFISQTVGVYINSPQQRLIQGATALVMQPLIDFNNKRADDETRAVSVARTIGKIVAGTIVGVTVRAGAIRLARGLSAHELITIKKLIKGHEQMIVTGIKKKGKKDIFTPVFANIKEGLRPDEFEVEYTRYVKTMGTIIATVAMVFTNFLIDAPLTKFITKGLTSRVKGKIDKNNKKKEGTVNSA